MGSCYTSRKLRQIAVILMYPDSVTNFVISFVQEHDKFQCYSFKCKMAVALLLLMRCCCYPIVQCYIRDFTDQLLILRSMIYSNCHSCFLSALIIHHIKLMLTFKTLIVYWDGRQHSSLKRPG